MTTLHWTKLANGDLLCVEHPIRLGKPVSRGAEYPGWQILAPVEPDPDYGDGWRWSIVNVEGEVWPLEARNERDARGLVVEQLHYLLRTVADSGYSPRWEPEVRQSIADHETRRWEEWLARKAGMDAVYEAGRAARIATGTLDGSVVRMADQQRGSARQAAVRSAKPRQTPVDREAVRAELLAALVDEYGADEHEWTAVRSLDRVTDRIMGVL